MIEFVEGTSGVIEGAISELLVRHERDGFTVADFELDDGRHLKVVGPLADAPLGTPLALDGTIERDPRFGLQFRVSGTIDTQLEADLALGYLSSGLVSFVGPATAAEIVDAFGADTLRKLVFEPERLTDFRGITTARLPKVRRSLRETVHLAAVIGLLDRFGVSLRVCRRVHRRYGASAVELVRANPWRLANEISGVGFLTADKVARGLGRALDAPERLEAAVLQALRDAAAEGGNIIVPGSVLAAAAAALTARSPAEANAAIERLVTSEEIERIARPEGYALPRLAAAERLIAARLRAISAFTDPEPVSVADAEIAILEADEGIIFDASQRRAIKGALEDRVTIITGDPGTGKTTIVRAVLDIADRRHLSYALVSPTGRAAKRLSEATGRPAMTIHRWLRYHPETGFAGPAELPELLVCDEVSMLDSALAAHLVSSLPPYARLLLVGDENQLPAVGPGNVLGDLTAAPFVHVLRLVTIHRTAHGSGVPELARQIRTGVTHPVFDRVSTRFVPRETPEEIAAWIHDTFTRYAGRADEFQVLAPMKKGPAGTDALNAAIQAIVNPEQPGAPALRRGHFSLRVGDRVLQTTNDYENDLFNGDIGYLREIGADGSLALELEGTRRSLPPGGGEGLTLAYAMTVHRAQGSEFEIVIIPMHFSSYLLLERRLFYTAVARARRTAVVVGQAKAMRTAISRHDPLARRTLLGTLLAGGLGAEVPLIPLGDFEDDLF